jgi:hypothetical protein
MHRNCFAPFAAPFSADARELLHFVWYLWHSKRRCWPLARQNNPATMLTSNMQWPAIIPPIVAPSS